MEQKHAMDRERQRIARSCTDDLGADLTEIGLVAEAAAKAKLPQRWMKWRCSPTASTRDRLLDAIVWR